MPSRLRFDSSLGQERIDRRVALIQGNERKRLEHVLEFLDGEPSAAPLLWLLVASALIEHRVGMRFAIDVAFVDSSGRARKIVQALVPWRIAMSPLASSAVEFTVGALRGSVLRVGDRLVLAEGSEHVARPFQSRGSRGVERPRDRRERFRYARGAIFATVAPRCAAVSSQNSTTNG